MRKKHQKGIDERDQKIHDWRRRSSSHGLRALPNRKSMCVCVCSGCIRVRVLSGYIYVHVCLGAKYAFSYVLDSYAYAYVSIHTRMRVWVHTCMRMWGAYGSVFLFRNFVMFSQSEKFRKSGKSSIGRFHDVAKSGYKPHVKV
jgi:hypothetical protein